MTAHALEKLHIYLTNKCNLHCRHCWVNASPGNNDIIDALDIIECIKQAIPLGLKAIKITGGEPLLFPLQLFSIFEFAAANNLQISLETNATLLKPEYVLKLFQYGVKVYISLDGNSDSTHNHIRGHQDSYLKTIEAIQLLGNNSVEVNIISCIYSINIHEIDDIIATCNELNVASLKFNFPNAYGRANNLKQDGSLLSTEKIISTIELLIKKYKTLPFPLDFDVPRVFKINYNDKPRCSLFNILSILPDGRYSLCGIGVTHKWVTFGIINTNSVSEVWRDSGILNDIRKLKHHRPKGVCKYCAEYSLCYGHCLAHIITELGCIGDSNPFCQNAFDCNLFPKNKLDLPL